MVTNNKIPISEDKQKEVLDKIQEINQKSKELGFEFKGSANSDFLNIRFGQFENPFKNETEASEAYSSSYINY